MTREAAVLVMVAVAIVLLGLMAWGWWRRSRRDAGLTVPRGELPADARVLATFHGLYVATTAHDAPLERLAVRGLGFRSRVDITVADTGVVLDMPGQERIVIAAGSLVDVDQSTVAIDRVVEADGLTRLGWRIADDRVVDSYFRPQDASSRALADAIRPLVRASSATGTDA